MNEEKISLRMMPWKHKTALVMMLVTGMILLLRISVSNIIMIKSILLYIVLTLASYLDFRFRIIPDWIHFVIIAIGFININVAKSLFGLIISPLPFLFMALINNGSIGGGDIKLIGASGFVMGYAKTSTACLVALALAIFYSSLYYLGKKRIRMQSFPFVPFFQIGIALIIVASGVDKL